MKDMRDFVDDKIDARIGLIEVRHARLREWRALGDAAGLSQFGVSLTILPPAAWPAQRHWHMNEDEFTCWRES